MTCPQTEGMSSVMEEVTPSVATDFAMSTASGRASVAMRFRESERPISSSRLSGFASDASDKETEEDLLLLRLTSGFSWVDWAGWDGEVVVVVVVEKVEKVDGVGAEVVDKMGDVGVVKAEMRGQRSRRVLAMRWICTLRRRRSMFFSCAVGSVPLSSVQRVILIMAWDGGENLTLKNRKPLYTIFKSINTGINRFFVSL